MTVLQGFDLGIQKETRRQAPNEEQNLKQPAGGGGEKFVWKH